MDSSGCRTVHARVENVYADPNGGFTVETAVGTRRFDRVVIATGGMSYPRTGSTGDGYRFARALGHTVTPLSPSLVPVESDMPLCAGCMGLTLKNIALTVREDGKPKPVYSGFGEMLFTHFGTSGPLILSAVVTSGGVSVKELDPKTMESKLVPGLYFAGEIIDVDGYTGGYNLQIAWSTGHAAGIAAASAGNNDI